MATATATGPCLRARVAGSLLAMVVAAAPRAARADGPPSDSVQANDLFFQGKSLMDEGDVAAACSKFGQSLALQRRGGTLLNLAVCRAAQKRFATALKLFEEALDLAKRDGKADRQRFARSQIEEVRSKLSWLSITPAAAARVAGLKVERDGEDLTPEGWGTPHPVDPGQHTVSAGAPGAKRFEMIVVVDGPGDLKSVEIPPLAPVTSSIEARVAPVVRSVPASPAASAPTPAPASIWASAPDAELLSTAPVAPRMWRPLGWGAAGVGTAALGVGLAFGLKAYLDNRDVKRECPDRLCATDAGIQKSHDAATEVAVADVMVLAGASLVGVGVYLLLSRSSGPAAAPAANGAGAGRGHIQITPVAGPGAAALTVDGAW